MNEILWPLVALYLIVVVVSTVVLVSSSGVFLGANPERSGGPEQHLPAADLRQSGSAKKAQGD